MQIYIPIISLISTSLKQKATEHYKQFHTLRKNLFIMYVKVHF